MATWRAFEQAAPGLAKRGREILHTFGVPLGYLATVRKDGGPRDDEFFLSGRAALREDRSLENDVRAAYRATGGGSDGSERLFEFDVERALLATYEKRGEPNNWPPVYQKWKDPGGAIDSDTSHDRLRIGSIVIRCHESAASGAPGRRPAAGGREETCQH
jgi:hypothetical protein